MRRGSTQMSLVWEILSLTFLELCSSRKYPYPFLNCAVPENIHTHPKDDLFHLILFASIKHQTKFCEVCFTFSHKNPKCLYSQWKVLLQYLFGLPFLPVPLPVQLKGQVSDVGSRFPQSVTDLFPFLPLYGNFNPFLLSMLPQLLI